MSAALFLDNLLAWSLQVAVLVCAGAALPLLLRLKEPKPLLVCWQLLLALCLVLPWLQPLAQPGPVQPEGMVDVTSSAVTIAAAPRLWLPSTPQAVLVLLAAGALIRLGWLGLGVLRLHRLRRHARPVDLPLSLPARCEILISELVAGPVTFGVLRPVILLPAGFLELPAPTREAILFHELIHIRRRDWVFTVADEIIRALLWFHPAIWWLLGRIHLTREQVVDREVVAQTAARQHYLDALLTVAGNQALADLAPAPLFLRKRHLAQRVAAILKETTMSKPRLYSSLASLSALLALTAWLAVIAFPLRAPAQTPPAVEDPVKVQKGADNLLHRAPIRYPKEALEHRIEGSVALEITVNDKGNVTDARVISGPEPLRKAALQSVLEWHYAPDSQPRGPQQVTVDFRLPKVQAIPPPMALPPLPEGLVLQKLEFAGVSDRLREALTSRLPVREGDPLTAETMNRIQEEVRAIDEHLGTSFRRTQPGVNSKEMTLRISYAAAYAIPNPATVEETNSGRIRVGGNVQSAKLVSKVNPLYPALAKQARIQGTVRFNVTINKDGTVNNLELLSGHPLLVPPSVEAVKQWVYQPTLLNGQPVEVITVVDVNYTLIE